MKKVFALVLTLTLGLALAACGTTEETEWAQGITDDTIYVGNTAVTTGDFGFVGQPFVAGMEAYFAMVNRDGGILGRNIELIHESDGFDADQGSTLTQRLVEEDEVFAMVGHFGTPTVVATLDYLNTLGVPRVYYATGSTQVSNEAAENGERASFPVQPTYTFEGHMMVARAHTYFEAEKIGLLYTGDEVGLEIKAGVEAEAAEHGIEIVAAQVGGDDHDSEALSIVNADVDIVILGANQGPAVTALYALLGQGNTVPVLTSYVTADASFIDFIAPVLGVFDVYANAWVDLFDDTGEDFNDAYYEFQAEIEEAYKENTFAIAGWIAAMTFVEGISRFGEDDIITWEAFIDIMEGEIFDYALGSPIDFSDGKRLGTQTMSLLQMQHADEVSYFDVVAPFTHIDDLLE